MNDYLKGRLISVYLFTVVAAIVCELIALLLIMEQLHLSTVILRVIAIFVGNIAFAITLLNYAMTIIEDRDKLNEGN